MNVCLCIHIMYIYFISFRKCMKNKNSMNTRMLFSTFFVFCMMNFSKIKVKISPKLIIVRYI